MNLVFPSLSSARNRSSTLIVLLGLILLGQLVLTSALEIHHIFAEVDHDGHQHSDFDLCKWVQQHTSGSLAIEFLAIETPFNIEIEHPSAPEVLYSSQIVRVGGSRAPPLSA